MKTPAAVLAFSALNAFSALAAADFDNWYFTYFSAPTESTKKCFDGEGNQVETAKGSSTGAISKDSKEFVQTARYETTTPGTLPFKVEATLRWKRSKDGSFIGEYTDSNGLKSSYSMVLKDRKRFRVESTAPNGMTIVADGRFDKDGKVYSERKIHTKDGQLVATIKTVISKKKTEEVEQDGGGKGEQSR